MNSVISRMASITKSRLFYLFVFLLIPFFIPFEVNENIYAWRTTMDVTHMWAFLLMDLMFIALFRQLHYSRYLLLAFFSSLLLAVCIELFQSQAGREASFIDISYGMLGASYATVAYVLWHRPVLKRHGMVIAVTVLLVMIASSSAALCEWYAIYWRNANLPLLSDFETPVQQRLWHAYGDNGSESATAELTSATVRDGSSSLCINTVSGVWSGVNYDAGGVSWLDYSTLHYSIYNLAKKFVINLRIDGVSSYDEYDRRFNTVITVQPGWNDYRFSISEMQGAVPTGEAIFGAVRRLVLFNAPESPAGSFCIDSVWLR